MSHLKRLVAGFAAIASIAVIGLFGSTTMEVATDSAPAAAANYCAVNSGYTGSTGSYANLRDTSVGTCWGIIRTMTRCTGPAGTIWLYGPWRGVNGTNSTAYCSSTGGAYPYRISRSYQFG